MTLSSDVCKVRNPHHIIFSVPSPWFWPNLTFIFLNYPKASFFASEGFKFPFWKGIKPLIKVFCCRLLLNISQLLNIVSNISPHVFFQIGLCCQAFSDNNILLINSLLKNVLSNRIFISVVVFQIYINCSKK